jgi:hypothetical protein
MPRLPLHVVTIFCISMVSLAAQGTGRLTGNPTPGTPQPDPPRLADRITVTGCVRWAAANGRGAVPTDELNALSDSKFLLVNAAREERVPPGTGTSDAAKQSTSQMYRLSALNSVLVPFVGSRVEISGEVEDRPPGDGGSQAPILKVGFVQRLPKTTCP